MIYNDFSGKKLSSLGMGCMRLPMLSEKETDIDVNATKQMLKYAFDNGINYFDTAWGYHGGNSEKVMGALLKEYPRDSFYLASKFPGFSVENFKNKEKIFQEQLNKCQVDYFDFYLFHCVSESSIDNYLNPEYKLLDYLLEQKKNGRIHHLGFSCHCNMDTFKRFFEAYGEHIEFVQIQINWLDWEFQDAKQKVEFLSKYNIPVWVMEPVRGGSLINLKPAFEQRLKALDPNVDNAEWGFRFVQNIPEVTMTLSGMSNLEQLKQNIAIYSSKRPLSKTEVDTLLKIGRDMSNKDALPCTACGYCLSVCPKGLNIPSFTDAYNEYVYSQNDFVLPSNIQELSDDKLSTACIACKACETVCPQNIKISEMMQNFSEKLLK